MYIVKAYNHLTLTSLHINFCQAYAEPFCHDKRIKCGISTRKWPSLAWENCRYSRRHHWFSREVTSEKRAEKFHTDDVSLPRSGKHFWLVKNLLSPTRSISKNWIVTKIKIHLRWDPKWLSLRGCTLVSYEVKHLVKTQGSYRAVIFSNFPDLKNVRKMEIKSEKNGKKSWVFF